MQAIISTARAVLLIGVVISVLFGAVFGFALAEVLNFPRPIGALLGGAFGFVLSSVGVGVAAAIFDIQEQVRFMADQARAQAVGGVMPRTDAAHAPVASMMSEASAAPEAADAPKPRRFREGPEGWELLIAEAKRQGWTVQNGLTGITFTHPATGERIKCNKVAEAEQVLKL